MEEASAHTLPAASAVVIEYPGYVRNVSRAVETLGSEDALRKCVEENSSFLKLRQRPSDPFCHPIFGERHAAPGLLLPLPLR